MPGHDRLSCRFLSQLDFSRGIGPSCFLDLSSHVATAVSAMIPAITPRAVNMVVESDSSANCRPISIPMVTCRAVVTAHIVISIIVNVRHGICRIPATVKDGDRVPGMKRETTSTHGPL